MLDVGSIGCLEGVTGGCRGCGFAKICVVGLVVSEARRIASRTISS